MKPLTIVIVNTFAYLAAASPVPEAAKVAPLHPRDTQPPDTTCPTYVCYYVGPNKDWIPLTVVSTEKDQDNNLVCRVSICVRPFCCLQD